MQVYKRSLWVMFKGVLMAPCAAVVVFFILNMFVGNNLILFGVPVVVFFVFMNMALFSENIRFELDPDGTVRYYQKGRLKNTYKMEECVVGYHSRSDGSSHDIKLNILNVESGAEESIDCSPLGQRCFANLYENLKMHTNEEPEVLKA